MAEKKTKKKKSFIGWIIFIVIMLLSSLDEYEVRRFFIRLKYSEEAQTAFVIAAIAIAVILITVILKMARKSVTQDVTLHSHDRINKTGVVREKAEGLDHYKIQLDGFLQAGIIDRKEYAVLLEKYRKTLKEKK